jgi:exosortase
VLFLREDRVGGITLEQVAAISPETVSPEVKGSPKRFDFSQITSAAGFPYAVALAAILTFVFWSLLKTLPGLWFKNDSAYSHGVLVPFLAGYILIHKWERLKSISIKPSILAMVLILPICYVAFVASRTSNDVMLARAFVLAVGLSVASVAGWRMAWATLPAVLYLFFALPVWTQIIDRFTQPMQIISSAMSVQVLKALGYDIYEADSTTILLSHFQMNVGAPCSGLKLMISLMALMVFFVLIADLKWWANLFLAIFIFPLAILTNGLRIAMIGMVGNSFGDEAGHQFHDYSGYLSLIICFIVIQKVCRALGWK